MSHSFEQRNRAHSLYHLQNLNMTSNSAISHALVDTESSVLALINVLQALPKGAPCLYVDLEGVSLSRHGSISIVTLFVQPHNCVYLVDVHKLQAAAFNTAAADGTTLKSVFESPDIIKVFFDLRNDSDALFHHYGVRLSGVEDIQLMENAGRPASQRTYVNGLGRCINQDAPISAVQMRDWRAAKDIGLKLFNPLSGGSYEIFNQRPLNPDVERYCVIDVQFLPLLRNLYLGRLDSTWQRKVIDETTKRVQESQSPQYQPNSEKKKFGPWR